MRNPQLIYFVIAAAFLFSLSTAAKNGTIGSHIYSGFLAMTGQFPWQASLVITISGGSRFCGGALIHPQWVVTAAHCTQGATGVAVRLGSLIRLTPVFPITVPIANIFNHFAYNAALLHNDIALIKLPSPVALSATIQKIDLLPVTQSCSNTIRAFHMTGWGITAAGGALSNDLRYTRQLEVLPSACISTHGVNKVLPTTLCAYWPSGAPFVTPCKGDDGGGLVLPGNIPYLVAIFSFSPPTGCGNADPAAYVQVTPYKPWMNTVGCPV